MLFNSIEFMLLLGASLALFWAIPAQRAREGILLVASLGYYAFWYPPHLLLLAGLVLVAWGAARLTHRTGSRWPTVVGCILAFGALAYWKYAAFVVQNVVALLAAAGVEQSLAYEAGALPLGISFIVFQTTAYMIDVQRREIPAESSYLRVLLFIAFFPQLVAGPICRGAELMPQLRRHASFDAPLFAGGFVILALGLLLKVTFADNLAPFVNQVYGNAATATGSGAWFGTLAFAVQILADFWGYSTMAVGMGMMFNIAIPVNFETPYLATSLRDFWRRWHITLSFWLRDYLYKALGGSRHGPARTAASLMLTMLIGGLWHGASWTCVIWGGIHGAWLVCERLARHYLGRFVVGAWPRRLSAPLGWLVTLLVVVVAWVFFRAPSLTDAIAILTAMKSFEPASDVPAGVYTLLAAFAVLYVPIDWLMRRARSTTLSISTCFITGAWLLIGGVVFSADEAVQFIYFVF